MEEKRYSRPVSFKVWGGSLDDGGMTLKTGAGEFRIPWDDVELICIGNVIDVFDRDSIKKDSTGTGIIKSMPLVGRFAAKRSREMVERSNYYIGIVFAKSNDSPFRFDNQGTNFREFLGSEAGYSGVVNFLKCMKKIIDRASNAFLDQSADRLVRFGKKFVAEYKNMESMIEAAWVEYQK